jgi:hypothetical protein
MDLTAAEMAQLAHDRFEIADAMHRFAFGLDHGDPDSLASAFAEDGVIDFRAAGRKLGLEFPAMTGRDLIVQTLIPLLGPLDTSHTASNLQIEVSGDTATLHGYMMSQHFMPGQGSRHGSDFALLMNRYDAELVRDGQKWRFKRLKVDNAWADGDPEILNALAMYRATKGKPRK